MFFCQAFLVRLFLCPASLYTDCILRWIFIINWSVSWQIRINRAFRTTNGFCNHINRSAFVVQIQDYSLRLVCDNSFRA
nr:MAG TPA: hypothetical protein [Caudoviricetes sp.]